MRKDGTAADNPAHEGNKSQSVATVDTLAASQQPECQLSKQLIKPVELFLPQEECHTAQFTPT